MEREEKLEIKKKMANVLFIPSLILGIVATFCLYSNFNSITMLVFVASVILYNVYVAKKLGYAVKKGVKFYGIGMLLLAIADCTTAFSGTVFYNNCMIFILIIGLQMYMFYDQNSWSNMKYVNSFFATIFAAIACLGDIFTDVDIALKGTKSEKVKNLFYYLLGILLFIPIGMLLIWLLSSADAVFDKIVEDCIDKIFRLETFVYIPLFFAVMFVGAYCVIRFLTKGELDKQSIEKTSWHTAIVNTLLLLISVTYIAFSMVQILSLFLGKMALPEGYTYAKYAREGFGQLLFVSFFNVCLVLFVKGYFKYNNFTKILLVLVSICTYIMLASSFMRLLLYIRKYDMSITRVEALWALVMVAAGMALVIISVFRQKFHLVHALVTLGTIGFFVLSVSHPDAIVTKYNLEHSTKDIDIYYLQNMTVDSAKYITQQEGAWVDAYKHDRLQEADERSFREFNLSWAINKKYLR